MATPTSLPASFSAGAVLTAAQMNNLRGAFRVLQVIAGNTSTNATTSGTALVDSNLTATITPSATSSKILICVAQNGVKTAAINTGVKLALLRSTTVLTTFAQYLGYNTSSTDTGVAGSMFWLDSPNTTSATTYKTQFARNGGSGTVEVQNNAAESSIILLEISA